jgi:trans-aconitate methyltransferase
VSEWRLFPEGTVPEYTTAEWYLGRERAPHLEQADHQPRLRKAQEYVLDMVEAGKVASVVDLGCGDGGLLSTIQARVKCWGYDLSPEAVSAAQAWRGVDAMLLDVVTDWYPAQSADLAVATEMLEHLVSPHGFLTRVASRCRYLVASSPGFETGANHYEFHTWAWDMDGYRAMVEKAGYKVLRHELANGFQVLLGGPR